jgi:hypothetical protein
LEVSGQLHAPAALSSGEKLPESIGKEIGRIPITGLDEVKKRKFLTPPGLELSLKDIASKFCTFLSL